MENIVDTNVVNLLTLQFWNKRQFHTSCTSTKLKKKHTHRNIVLYRVAYTLLRCVSTQVHGHSSLTMAYPFQRSGTRQTPPPSVCFPPLRFSEFLIHICNNLVGTVGERLSMYLCSRSTLHFLFGTVLLSQDSIWRRHWLALSMHKITHLHTHRTKQSLSFFLASKC